MNLESERKYNLRHKARELESEIEELEQNEGDHATIAVKMNKLKGVNLQLKGIKRERITTIEIIK